MADQAPSLLEHQRGDVEWAKKVGRGLLANEPGLGKSRSAIEATKGARTLVIAPNLVLTGGTWDDEIARWADDPSLYTQASYQVLNARAETTGAKGGKGTTPIKQLRPEFREKFDAVIVDEAHYTKGRKTSWTWATQKICAPADMVIQMTGTPIPNWAHELFTLLQVIFPDQAGRGQKYGSFWRWAEAWFDCSPTRFSNGMPSVGELRGCMLESLNGGDCLARPSNDPCRHYVEFAEHNLGEHYRRMLREDCLDLPPITTQEVATPMSAAARRIYRELKKDFVATCQGQEVVAWSQGAANVMLDKVTTSPWLLTKEGKARGGKLDQLAFDLEGRSRPTLVLAHYRDTVEACEQVAEQVGASSRFIHGGTSDRDRSTIVKRFKAGDLDVLVGSLETLAEGLTLTVADMAIFVEKSFKPSRNEQARYRVHRMGQERPVTIKEYLTPDSVDARKRKLLATKTDRQMRYLTAAELIALL